MSAGRGGSTDRFLAAGLQVAHQICRDAIWYEDQCNWVGAAREEAPGGQPTLAYRSLGPDLYGGTSGVAVFLAHAHDAAGEPADRRTSLGAIRHAIATVDRLDVQGGPGLYTGRLGVALAAAWVGAVLREAGLLEQAATIVDGLEPFSGKEYDLLSGRAGAIVGLVVLRRLLGDDGLLRRAVRFGDELLECADQTRAGFSWASPGYPTLGNLTGLSHGAAGAATALLELFAATGDPAYRHGAEQAFAYERSLFDPEARNWPDLRAPPGRGEGVPPSFATFWCHGAPGIALSRLRGYELLQDEILRTEACAAVQTTTEAVAAGLSSRAGNYSLCHGHAGNAEVLLDAATMLGSSHGPGRDLAREVAEAGIESHGNRPEPWPCGTHEGVTPNLFLGLAGIGHFYLRLHNPRIPSPVMLRPEVFACDAIAEAAPPP